MGPGCWDREPRALALALADRYFTQDSMWPRAEHMNLNLCNKVPLWKRTPHLQRLWCLGTKAWPPRLPASIG